MEETQNSNSSMFGSIIKAIDRCWNPSWNDENQINLITKNEPNDRNKNGGDCIRSARTPSTDENEEDSINNSPPKDNIVPYEDDAELLRDVKTAKTEEHHKGVCPVLCFDCNDKNGKTRTSKKAMSPNQNQSNKQNEQNTQQTKKNHTEQQIDASNISYHTRQSIEKSKEEIEKNIAIIQKLNNARVHDIFRNKSSTNSDQEKQSLKKQRNYTTTNWKHVFWNNYFRNNNSSSSGQQQQRQRVESASTTPPKLNLPFDTLSVPPEFKRTDISELTMKSSHAHYHYHNAITTTALLDTNTRSFANSRVMAYYAVGQHCPKYENVKKMSNRRCYFTGKMIINGMPFYAGSLKQGYKTLVVFCLPEAIGLPQTKEPLSALTASTSLNTSFSSSLTNENIKRHQKLLNQSTISESSSNAGSNADRHAKQKTYPNSALRNKRNFLHTQQHPSHSTLSGTLASSNGCYSVSHDYSSTYGYLSSSSYSAADDYNDDDRENCDPNLSTCNSTNYQETPSCYDDLLEQLPNPSPNLLQTLQENYPEAFKTLPTSIQTNVESWSIYNKFCYFSGLPICPGDLHYKYNIEKRKSDASILLSHEIMEVVLGKESADLVRLPNTAVFDYLKVNYKHQFCRLEEDLIFERYAWQVVLPEV